MLTLLIHKSIAFIVLMLARENNMLETNLSERPEKSFDSSLLQAIACTQVLTF
jgi:hypothetical protein